MAGTKPVWCWTLSELLSGGFSGGESQGRPGPCLLGQRERERTSIFPSKGVRGQGLLKDGGVLEILLAAQLAEGAPLGFPSLFP